VDNYCAYEMGWNFLSNESSIRHMTDGHASLTLFLVCNYYYRSVQTQRVGLRNPFRPQTNAFHTVIIFVEESVIFFQ